MISGDGTEGTGRTEERNEARTEERAEERNKARTEARAEGTTGAERAGRMEGTPRGDRPAPMKGRVGQAAQAGDLGGGGRTSRTTDIPARKATDAGTAAREGSAHDTRLVAHDDTDKLSLRLQHAVGGFVDGPRASIEEADHVLEEAAERLTEAVTQRRRTLRASWQTPGEDSADTEQLRLALRDYRELTERLLKL